MRGKRQTKNGRENILSPHAGREKKKRQQRQRKKLSLGGEVTKEVLQERL